MTGYTKPPVFNAVQAMKRIDEQESRIRQLEDEKHRLEMRLIELKADRTNLEIKCRILEERLQSIG